ncbi:MAG: hypothetical protein LBS01_05150 [Prevotellaceae bacterium]|jgi:hypothetical protein|nr:hypothetical protein [Prevotellaceae bacterium]
MKKVKFSNLSGNSEANFLANNKTALKAEEMSLILGGDGCSSQICANNRRYGVEEFCPSGTGACTSGLGTCTENTGPSVVPVNPTTTCTSNVLINYHAVVDLSSKDPLFVSNH